MGDPHPKPPEPPPFRKAASLQEIYAPGAPTGLTRDIRSALYVLPDKTPILAGFREEGNCQSQHDINITVRGDDTFYVAMHGGGYVVYHYNTAGGRDPLNDNYFYGLGTPRVQINEAKTTDQDLGDNALGMVKPSSWPDHGYEIRPEYTQAEQNYVRFAKELNDRNPRWIIAEPCNWLKPSADGKPPLTAAFILAVAPRREGVTPKFYDEMILRKDKRLEFVVMNEPGYLGFGGDTSQPLGYETPDKEQLAQELAGKTPLNAPQLYHKMNYGWEDRGTFVSNRIVIGSEQTREMFQLELAQDRATEQFEIRQMGEAEYMHRMAMALKSGDQRTIELTLACRPALRKAFEDRQHLTRDTDGKLNFTSGNLKAFSAELEAESKHVCSGQRKIRLLDPAYHENPPQAGPNRYRVIIFTQTTKTRGASTTIPARYNYGTTVERGTSTEIEAPVCPAIFNGPNMPQSTPRPGMAKAVMVAAQSAVVILNKPKADSLHVGGH